MMRMSLASVLVAVACLLAAPSAPGVGTGGTGLYMRGALAVAPGVVVNNITFDAAQASITINGHHGSSGDDLHPGMVAGIVGNVVPGQQYGTASQIGVTRATLGMVARVGTGGTGLYAVGVYVATRTDTVYAGLGSIADLSPGDGVDVYGYSDGVSGTIYATRIERVAAPANAELHGIVASLGSGTFVLQGVTVDDSGAQLVGFSGPVAIGDRVGVDGTINAQGVFVATTVTFEPDTTTQNGEEAEIEDGITAVLTPTLFVVDGFVVDASKATFSGGSAASLAVGRLVHVEGRTINGDLVASSVEFNDDGEDSSDSAGGNGNSASEVDGSITSLSSPTMFVVNGVTIDASTATFANGPAANVALGRYVKVVGARSGSTLKATRVTFVTTSSSSSSGEVEGKVTGVNAPGVYAVGSVVVDARSATVSGGTLATIKPGTKIEASGAWQSGTLVAKRLSIDD